MGKSSHILIVLSQRTFASLQEGSPNGDTVVAVGGPQAIFVCCVSSDGRLTVLHNLNRPPEEAADSLPHVAFYLKQPVAAVAGSAAST